MANGDGDGDHDSGRRFLDGDPETLDQARRLVESVVRHHGIPSAERADTVQQVLTDAFKRLRTPGFTLRKDVACLLGKIAHARCLDWRNRQRPTVPVREDIPDPGIGPYGVILENERRWSATLALRRLTPSCRRLIDLHIYHEVPYAVIATLLGRSEGALRVEMCNCLKKARQWIEGPDKEPPRPTAGGQRARPKPAVESRPTGSKR